MSVDVFLSVMESFLVLMVLLTVTMWPEKKTEAVGPSAESLPLSANGSEQGLGGESGKGL